MTPAISSAVEVCANTGWAVTIGGGQSVSFLLTPAGSCQLMLDTNIDCPLERALTVVPVPALLLAPAQLDIVPGARSSVTTSLPAVAISDSVSAARLCKHVFTWQ